MAGYYTGQTIGPETSTENYHGRVWSDGMSTFIVPYGMTPETSPWNPANPKSGVPTPQTPYLTGWNGAAGGVDPLSSALGGGSSNTSMGGYQPAQTSSMSLPTSTQSAMPSYAPTDTSNLYNLYVTGGGATTDTLANLMKQVQAGNGLTYTKAEPFRYPWESPATPEMGTAANEFNQWLQSFGGGNGASGVNALASAMNPAKTWSLDLQGNTTYSPAAAQQYSNDFSIQPAGGPPITGPGAFSRTLGGGSGLIQTQPSVLTVDQDRALQNSGGRAEGDNRPVIDEYGNVRSSNNTPANQATQLPKDLTDALRALIQQSLQQGEQGAANYSGLTNDIRNFLDFSRKATTDTMGRQDELTNQMLGRINPALDQALGLMNQSPGLSPEAMAALRTQSTEGATRDYQGNVEALKTELARRGAAGGLNPAAFDETVRGYGNLQAARDQAKETGLREAILADEQRKFESLGLNRNTAMDALNTASGLTGTLGSLYNPAQYLGASEDALNNLTTALGGQNAARAKGLQTSADIANSLAELQPTSTASLLKNALIGTGLDVGTGLLESLLGLGDKNNPISDIGKALGIAGGAAAGAGAAGAAAGAGAAGAATAGTVPGSIFGGVLGPAPSAGGGISGALSTIAPFAVPAAAALSLYLSFKPSANDQADVWAKGPNSPQNAFGTALSKISDGFDQAAQAGTLTPDQAASSLKLLDQLWTDYNAKAQAFMDQEKPQPGTLADWMYRLKKTKDPNFELYRQSVIRQSHETLDPLISAIRQKIATAAGGSAHA